MSFRQMLPTSGSALTSCMNDQVMTDRIDFGSVREGAVLFVEVRPEEHELELVCDVPFAIGAPGRLFARLLFRDVRDLVRGGVHPRYAGTTCRFSAQEHDATFVVQGISVQRVGERDAIRLDLGPELGTFAFNCVAVTLQTRHARATPVAGGWQYRDATSGALIDFYAPFDDG